MNLVITNQCPRKCSFCFAQSRVGGVENKETKDFMPKESVYRIMEFLAKTDNKNLRLLGGEPTLHPDIMEIVEKAIKDDFHVHIFTNGIMSTAVANFLGDLPYEKLSVLCNVSPQAEDTEPQKERIKYALGKLEKKAQLGITLTSKEFEYEFLFDMIDRFKLQKRIRIGIAQPIVGKDNSYLLPSDYRETGKAIVKMAQECIKKDILIGFDCGLTLCMFSEEEIGIITKCTEGFRILCRPILDIGPNMDIWHCFPMSEVLNTHLDKFQTRNEIVNYFEKIVAPYKNIGCMPECLTCDYLRRGQCSGGCLAHTINSFNPLPPKYTN